MRNLFKKDSLIDLLFIFILSLTPLLWFRPGTIIVGHDNVFGLFPSTFLTGRLSTWIEHGFGQGQDLIMGTIPIHLIDAIPYLLGFSLQTTEKIVYVFWFFSIGLSAYILASTINPQSRIFKLTAVLLYQFNFFILQGWWIGERTKFSAYIALPLILTVFIKVYKTDLKLSYAVILNSLIFFLFNAGGLYGTPLYGGLFITLGAFIFFFSFLTFSQEKYRLLKRLLLLTIFSFLGLILVGSYYFLPAVNKLRIEYGTELGKVGGFSGLTNWANEISANTSYINLFRLQGIPEWYDNSEHPYAIFFLNNPYFIVSSFFWPLLIVLSLINSRKRKEREIIFFFLLVFLLGIFFSAGTHPPLGAIYTFLMHYIPGFAIFRTPYFKFAPAIFLATSFIIAFLVSGLPGKLRKVSFLFVILFIFTYHFPYFTGNFFSWRKGFSTRLQIPEYVFQFGNWFNSQGVDNRRILLLPPNSPYWRYSAYNWGYLSFQPILTLLTNKSILVNNDRLNKEEEELILELYSALGHRDKALVSKLTSLLGINYFLLQADAVPDPRESSLPLKPQVYQEILENDFELPIIQKFGRWSLYQIEPSLPKIFAKNSFALLSGPKEDLNNYYDFTPSLNLFAWKEDFPKNLQFPNNLVNNFYIPDCLNCPIQDKPFIYFPERNVLPDSPLYPLILFNENLKLRNKETKNLIYDYIGISLKRIAEMKEMTLVSKKITEPVINRYQNTLRQININFNKLAKYEDKLQVADDLKYYLGAERSYLSDLLGESVTSGESITVLGRALQSIAQALENIEPYLFKLDTANNRLYQFSTDPAGDYFFYLKKDNLQGLLREGAKISLTVDDDTFREIKIDSSKPLNSWFSFGKIKLNKGTHRLLLSLPELPNTLSEFKAGTLEFTSTGTNCFLAKVNDFDFRKLYKIKINYQNDFSYDLLFYTWEIREKQSSRLMDVDKLKSGFTEEEITKLKRTYSEAKGLGMGFCSKSLTADLLSRKIVIKVNEIIYPRFLIVPEEQPVNIIKTVDFRRLSPVKYEVSFTNPDNISILAFMERFDSGWSLLGFEGKHFRLNGYANGWLIDKKGEIKTVLEYQPQKIFILGVVVSLSSIILGGGYLLGSFRKKSNESE